MKNCNVGIRLNARWLLEVKLKKKKKKNNKLQSMISTGREPEEENAVTMF